MQSARAFKSYFSVLVSQRLNTYRVFILRDRMQDKISEQDKRREVAKLLITAMKNHPPIKEDMLKIFETIKTAFPELPAFKATIENLPSIIPEWLWETGHVYDLYITVENMLKVKRFSDKKAKDTFAYLMWLSTILILENELRNLVYISNRVEQPN